MKIYKAKDEILKAVLAEIHKTVQKPDKGFMTVSGWAKKWGYAHVQTSRLISIALKSGVLEKRNYRICTSGRVRLMAHYGKPAKRSHKR
jgi:hypothetical protein